MAAELSARAAALAPPHAHGAPRVQAHLRVVPEDFCVEEDLGFEPAGSGAHVLLQVRKVNANTQWIARELARLAGCHVAEVGYAGIKDRRAVAVQWFSVPRPRVAREWSSVQEPQFSVLAAHPHNRKLPRGALAGNRFVIRLRAPGGTGAELRAALAAPLEAIEREGVPNYFGPQRFGREGANLERIGPDLGRLKPPERGFVLSAARAVVFNAVLAARVTAASWHRLLPGDLANLDGRGSIFAVDRPDASLERRCRDLEIHPTGPLWGAGASQAGGEVAQLEECTAAAYAAECRACTGAGMRQERRSLRLAVRALRVETEPQALVLHFRLTRGSFATAVLRELLACAGELPEG